MRILQSLFFILMLNVNCVFSQETIDKDKFLDAIIISNKVIYSGQGSYTYKYKIIDDNKYNILNQQAIKSSTVINRNELFNYNCSFFNKNIKIQRFDQLKKIKDFEASYNGTEFKRINYTLNKDGLLNAIGLIDNKTHSDRFRDDPIFITNKMILFSINSYKNNDAKINKLAKEIYKDKEYTVLEFELKDKSILKYFINPEDDFRIYFIKWDYPEENQEFTINYQNINNILFPKKILINTKENGVTIISKEIEFNDDWKLNINIDNNYFDLIFPKGTKISNSITGNTYYYE